MSRDRVLARGRQMAEAGMADACTIRRRTGETTDDLTGDVVPTYIVVYAGPCRVQQSVAMGQRADAGEASVIVQRRELQLPVTTSTAVRHEDEATVDACANDPGLVGRVFVIRDEHGKSEATARRLTIEERT